MAKLTGKKKTEFLERMAKGRRKAKRAGNPKAKSGPKKAAAKKPVKKAAKKNPAGTKLRGAKKAEFLERMAKGRRKAKRGGSPAKKNGKKKRRNPDTTEAAAQKFAEFHGKQPGRVIEYEQVYKYPENYAEMGKLIELRFDLDDSNEGFPLTGFKGTRAVCTPDGSNIYFIAGDQAIDFEALNIASDKDMVELGPCVYICYHTVKGFHDFEPIDYEHEFGEEDGITPVLAYDRLNKALFLIGGNYRVRPEGIVN